MMNTYNIMYTTDKVLTDFISLEHINNYSSILIQIYTAVHNIHDIKDLLDLLNKQLPQAKIIGCSTIDPIFNGEGVNKQCVISITVFENTIVSQKSYIRVNDDDYEIGLKVAEETCSCDTKLAIMLFCDYMFDIEKYIDGFSKVQPNTIISGGIASKTTEIFVFDNDNVYENGVVIATFTNPELYVNNCMINGIEPIGNEYEITKMEGKVIKEIGGIPAKDWYKKYLGDKIFLSEYMVTERFPLVVGEDPNLIRAVMYTEDDGLNVPIRLNVGDKLRVGYGNIKETIENCKFICDMISKVPIESLFVFSCLGRRNSMKECSRWELKPFKEDNNLSGFFTSGELLNLGGKNYIFNNVCTFLGLSESPTARLKLDFRAFEQIDELNNNENKALALLIHNINKDLFEANKLLIKKVMYQTEKIKEKLLVDELTGLGNINKYNFDLEIFNYTKIALLDITNFKLINNLYGNKLGDNVLIELSKQFVEYANENGLKVYSFYVDMFAFVADEKLSNEKFVYYIEQLHSSINAKCFVMDIYEMFFNTNVALVLNSKQLQDKAMLVLDYLKQTKESFLIYNKELNLEKQAENNFMWIKKIKRAIKEDRIIPYFQPIYNNNDNKCNKYEALIRLIDENDDVILPQYFLDIAKKTNLYKELTKIMVNKTFDFFENKDYEFSINITVDDILDLGVRNYILYKLELFTKPYNVIFELVETESIEQYSEIKSFILAIKKMGARIAIDDFGTGYSNLMYLIQLDVDIIKVDGSIIRSLRSDHYSNLVTNTVMYLANNLNIETVAEYVEDKNIFDKVKNMGIKYSQGYYFSRPEKDICD